MKIFCGLTRFISIHFDNNFEKKVTKNGHDLKAMMMKIFCGLTRFISIHLDHMYGGKWSKLHFPRANCSYCKVLISKGFRVMFSLSVVNLDLKTILYDDEIPAKLGEPQWIDDDWGCKEKPHVCAKEPRLPKVKIISAMIFLFNENVNENQPGRHSPRVGGSCLCTSNDLACITIFCNLPICIYF